MRKSAYFAMSEETNRSTIEPRDSSSLGAKSVWGRGEGEEEEREEGEIDKAREEEKER